MEQTISRGRYPVTFALMVSVFVSTLLCTDPQQSFAAAGAKKAAVTAVVTAGDRTEARIKQLHAVLKITDDQQEAWNALTLVMRENSKEMDTLAKVKTESSQIVNAVENMKFYYQVSKTHLEQQAKFIPPFEALYIGMSDEQKKTADLVFRTGKSGRTRIK
jgi:hypothetical protein